MPVSLRARPASWFALWALTAAMLLGSCAGRNLTGELAAPKDARPWETQFGPAFDDGYTKQVVELSGRAPNDVLDQRLFGARLGHADIVALCEVRQVWGRGRYQGKQDQYIELEIQETLLGQLPRGTEEVQTLAVLSEDELPGTLQGESMILFVRWAPEQLPSYHHHLMPAPEEIVGYIEAMVSAAQEAGVLDDKGRARKRPPRKARKSEADAAVSTEDEMPVP